MEHWKNISLENLKEEVDGILYLEMWAWLKRYPDRYMASNFGRMKSCAYGKERILRQAISDKGYLRVCLTTNYVKETAIVHREVANLFIPNPLNLPEVNHLKNKQGIVNKRDNRFFMIEWSSSHNNMVYSYECGRKPAGHYVGKKGANHPQARKIICLNTGVVYDTILQAAQELNLDAGNVGHVCRGDTKTTKGYKFKYV